jgi:hypothetical protein
MFRRSLQPWFSSVWLLVLSTACTPFISLQAVAKPGTCKLLRIWQLDAPLTRGRRAKPCLWAWKELPSFLVSSLRCAGGGGACAGDAAGARGTRAALLGEAVAGRAPSSSSSARRSRPVRRWRPPPPVCFEDRLMAPSMWLPSQRTTVDAAYMSIGIHPLRARSQELFACLCIRSIPALLNKCAAH